MTLEAGEEVVKTSELLRLTEICDEAVRMRVAEARHSLLHNMGVNAGWGSLQVGALNELRNAGQAVERHRRRLYELVDAYLANNAKELEAERAAANLEGGS